MIRTLSAVLCAVAMGTAANAADILRKAPPLPAQMLAPAPFMHVFTGFAAAPNSWFWDAGAVYAFNRNIDSPGWLLRVRAGIGEYDYKRLAGNTIIGFDTPFQVGEAMIGYQWFLPSGARLSAYAGVNVEHHDSDDVTAKIRGTEAGVKGQLELFVPLAPQWYFFGMATASSVWSSYFALGKVGYRVTPWLSIGPEVAALGNDRFDAQRLGVFAGFAVAPRTELILSVGHNWQDSDGNLSNGDGAYGTVHLRSTF